MNGKRAEHGNLEFFQAHSNVLRPEILSFSSSLKLRFTFTGKTQDFRAQHILRSPEKTQDFRALHVFRSPEKPKDFSVLHVFHSPEKLKISVLSIKVH